MAGASVGGPPGERSALAGTVELRPFVGRARELEELRSAFADSGPGRGSLVLVSGEPGIGKSRLMEELSRDAAAGGWRVLTGRCWDGGGAPAYWPWVQIVRAAGGEFERLAQPTEADAGSREHRRSSVMELVDPDAARFRLFEQVGRFLSETASRDPCLVVLDDLHAADEPSLLLLRFLATTGVERSLVLVGSYRDAEPRVRELAELFGELSRLGRRVPLRGLTAEEVATYIRLVTGERPSQAVALRVHDLTGGNPFFLGEVVRALAGEGRLSGADDAELLRLPEEVRALIRRRVANLSPETASALRIAAVVGREFDLRTIAPTSTLGTERLVDALAEAARAGVIAEDTGIAGSYAFAHDLVRAALYEDLPATRRMELHRTVGEVLEEVFRDDLDPHLAAIAHHFAQSAPIGDSDRAVEYSVRAGDRAAAMLAYEDAAKLYSRALQLLQPAETAAERRCEILLRLGDVQSRSADTEGARLSFDEAASTARRTGIPEILARAALGYVTSAVPVRLGFGGLLITALFEEGRTGVALLEEALGALPEGEGSLRARVLARLATELYTTNQTERRLTLGQEAVDMALRLGDPEALVEALHGRHWATLAPDSAHDRLANAQQMLLVATGAGEEEPAFLARHARLHCFLEFCDVGGVDAELDAMTHLAGRIRQPFYVWHAACLRAMRSMLEGRLDEAERQVREALEIGRLRQSEYVTYMFEYAQMVCIRWMQGRLDEVRDQIREHGERYAGIARWRDALAAAELGDERAARAEVERHARNDFADLPRDGLWILHMCALAQACVLICDERRAALLYEQLTPYADRNAISVSTMPFGPVAMRLGMLATQLERWDEAERHFALAAERCDAMGARAIRAIVLAEHARMLLARGAQGDAARAADLLAEAKVICEELNMAGILERVSRLSPPAPVGAGPDAPRATFRREGQYWTVAYDGEMARLLDRKGLRHIANLIAAPGREVHVLELVGAAEGDSTERLDEETARALTTTRLDGTEAVLDPKAKEAYRRRLRELSEELEEARAWHDPERAARLDAEIDALVAELERSLGLGGRDRGLPSPAERARVNVTKAIRTAIGVISKECPQLGQHLAASIRTGRFCSYAPPGREPPPWAL